MCVIQGNSICHWCERTNMFAKCKIFMNYSKNFIAVKKQIWLTNSNILEIIDVKQQIWLRTVKYL